MYEITELTKDENYRERILPVVKTGAGIFDPIVRNKYAVYWQDSYKDLYASSEKLDPNNRRAAVEVLLRYERIMRDLPVFLQDISDLYMIECEDSIDDKNFKLMMSIINTDENSAENK